jgi:hypothetical protein
MFPFPANNNIFLSSARRKGAARAANAEEHEFGHIPEIKTHTSTVRATILAYLVPHQVRFVRKPPGFKYLQAFEDQCIGNPEVEVALGAGEIGNRELDDFIKCHRAVPGQASVFGGHLPGAVGKLPGRVGKDRAKWTDVSGQ